MVRFPVLPRVDRDLVARCQYRLGVLHSIDRQLFSGLPPALTAGELEAMRASKHFTAGEEFGVGCVLSHRRIQLPHADPPEPSTGPSHGEAAIFCLGVVAVGVSILYAFSTI